MYFLKRSRQQITEKSISKETIFHFLCKTLHLLLYLRRNGRATLHKVFTELWGKLQQQSEAPLSFWSKTLSVWVEFFMSSWDGVVKTELICTKVSGTRRKRKCTLFSLIFKNDYLWKSPSGLFSFQDLSKINRFRAKPILLTWKRHKRSHTQTLTAWLLSFLVSNSKADSTVKIFFFWVLNTYPKSVKF